MEACSTRIYEEIGETGQSPGVTANPVCTTAQLPTIPSDATLTSVYTTAQLPTIPSDATLTSVHTTAFDTTSV
ncbi:hypothetical protein AALO_G00095970 [Alosa alosa]|uniref:Uncharacterized protein n=1 Tax=Alosa alosa TaxID=278164 RepID=A0AAV6GTG7_9TELE|nr:hypothetical protein AALO_G00095970 [Alosa alosa]